MSIQFYGCLNGDISIDTESTGETHVTSVGRLSGICDCGIKHCPQINDWMPMVWKIDWKFDYVSWKRSQQSPNYIRHYFMSRFGAWYYCTGASWWPGGLDRVGISLKKKSSSEEAIIVGLKSELICVKYATIFYYMQWLYNHENRVVCAL